MTAKAISPYETPVTGWRLRLRTTLRRGTLDRRLIAGEAPEASAELSRRAALLLDPAERHEIATALRLTLKATLDPEHGPGSKVSLNRAEIRAARPELEELCAALETEQARSARGVAMARRLVTDIASPLYSPCSSGELAAAARHARVAMLLH